MKFILSILIASSLFFAVAGQVQAAVVPSCNTQETCKVGDLQYTCKGVMGPVGNTDRDKPETPTYVEFGKCGGPCTETTDCASFLATPFSWSAAKCTGSPAVAAVSGTCATGNVSCATSDGATTGTCTLGDACPTEQPVLITTKACIAGTTSCIGGSAAKLASSGVCMELPPGAKQLPGGPATGLALLDLVDLATNWVFAIFVVLAIIFVLLAAFQFVTAGGEAEKVSEARQKLIWAAVGIVVALLAKGLVPVIKAIVGG